MNQYQTVSVGGEVGQFTIYRAISAGVSLQTGAGDYCVDQVVKHCQILLSSEMLQCYECYNE